MIENNVLLLNIFGFYLECRFNYMILAEIHAYLLLTTSLGYILLIKQRMRKEYINLNQEPNQDIKILANAIISFVISGGMIIYATLGFITGAGMLIYIDN